MANARLEFEQRTGKYECEQRAGTMAIHKIPVYKISTKSLKGVIEEFISRDATDYGVIEATF